MKDQHASRCFAFSGIGFQPTLLYEPEVWGRSASGEMVVR